jgi:hypothetical protein
VCARERQSHLLRTKAQDRTATQQSPDTPSPCACPTSRHRTSSLRERTMVWFICVWACPTSRHRTSSLRERITAWFRCARVRAPPAGTAPAARETCARGTQAMCATGDTREGRARHRRTHKRRVRAYGRATHEWAMHEQRHTRATIFATSDTSEGRAI